MLGFQSWPDRAADTRPRPPYHRLLPLSQGRLHPRRGRWLHSQRRRPTGEEQFTKTIASVLELQTDFGELAQAFSDAQADFDLGDEYVMEEFGRPEGDVLVVGEQRYGLVVWPPRMTNLRTATAQMLGEYLADGGHLYGVRPEKITVDGRVSDLLEQWEGRFQDNFCWFPDREALVHAVLRAGTIALETRWLP